tara:strand:- start:760 stop:1008 length:249 start_codon:yes stop_codon:yes gene_type:complete
VIPEGFDPPWKINQNKVDAFKFWVQSPHMSNNETNFSSAIKTAIATVAELLNEPIDKIAKESLTEGPVRESVMMLACNAATK